MALAEYNRKLEEHRRKMALGHELLTIIEAGTPIQVRVYVLHEMNPEICRL